MAKRLRSSTCEWIWDMENTKVCTVLVSQAEGDSAPSYLEMQKRVEKAGQTYMAKKSGSALATVLEELLVWMMNGEAYGKLLMHVIRYMVNCEDHRVKKLLQLYFELCDKLDANGELKEEMILVCNALLKDLNSHNEFVRGSTLRLLCRLRYYKLIEPLITSIIQNLQHRHSYVRRYAVICVYAVCKSFGLQAVPGASEAIEAVLITEGDVSTKRNCLLFLLQFDIDKCVRYVLSLGDQVTGLGDICQLVVVELCKKIAKLDTQLFLSKCRPILFNLMQSNSPAVAYDACVCVLTHSHATSTSTSTSSSDLAIHECIKKLVLLLFSQSDNSVKLIILDRLEELPNPHVLLADSTLDLLRALGTNPSISVRRRILHLTLAAVGSNAKNAEVVVTSLVKELASKAASAAGGATDVHESARVDILNAVRALAASLAPAAVPALVDALLEEVVGVAAAAAAVALATLRDLWTSDVTAAATAVPPPSEAQLARLRSLLPHVKGGAEVARGALWLLSEFDRAPSARPALLAALLAAVGPLPLTPETSDAATAVNKFRSKAAKNHFRAALFNDELLRSLLALTAARAALAPAPAGAASALSGRQFNETVFLVANLARTCGRATPAAPTTAGGGRMALVLRALTCGERGEAEKLLQLAEAGRDLAKEALGALTLETQRGAVWTAGRGKTAMEERSGSAVQFRQLRGAGTGETSEAAGGGSGGLFGKQVVFGGAGERVLQLDERLERTMALTGLSDAVYVEGCVLGVREYGTLQLELWVYNRTSEVVQNVSIDLFPEGASANASGGAGSLRVLDREKLQIAILKAGEAKRLQVNVKVETTQSARLHGYLAFEDKKNKKTQLVMAPVESDILDFIQDPHPAPDAAQGHEGAAGISVEKFKKLWAELEWENKVNVAASAAASASGANAGVKGFEATLQKVQKATKMRPLLPLRGELLAHQKIDFVSLNLYAKTMFGEDVLANVSLERDENGGVSGSVRIRAKTQGIALSIGDRIGKEIAK